MTNLPGLVLAAGFSRRMGRCKLTLPLDGEPLLRRVIRAAVDAGLSPVGVVMRPDTPELHALTEGFGSIVQNVPAPEAHFGQSASLKAGIRWLLEKETEALPGVVILLGDQPLVSSELIRTLTAAFLDDPGRAVAPEYEGVRGNPVILPRTAFDALLQLSGDRGARGLLTAFGLRLVPVNDRAAVTDVDTWEAYQQLQPVCLLNQRIVLETARLRFDPDIDPTLTRH